MSVIATINTATRRATRVNLDCHTSLSYWPTLEQLDTLSLLLWIGKWLLEVKTRTVVQLATYV